MRGARFGAVSGLLVLRGQAIIRLSRGFAPPRVAPWTIVPLSRGFAPPRVAPWAIIRRPFRPPVGAKDFVLAFAGIPQVFATMLQTSTDPPWYLQQCCKRQPTCRGFCNNVANVNRPAAAFATMLQTSTDPPWYLQQCCKRQPKLRGICNNVANVNRNSVAFATMLQTSTDPPRLLQQCCKDMLNKRLSFSYVGLTSTISH